MQEQIIGLLEQSLQVRSGTIEPTTELHELNGWDSMGIVSFVGEVFDQLDVELGVDDVTACAVVSDLVALVSQRSARR